MENFNAIVFFKPEKKIRTRKYRNISNLANFIRFLQKSEAWYCNLYNAKSRQFFKRYYID